MVDLLPQNNEELPIAIDATNVGQNFTILSINVLYCRCAIPVAWKVVKGTSKGSWKPHWEKPFQALKDIVPKNWKVIVSADRGLLYDGKKSLPLDIELYQQRHFAQLYLIVLSNGSTKIVTYLQLINRVWALFGLDFC